MWFNQLDECIKNNYCIIIYILVDIIEEKRKLIFLLHFALREYFFSFLSNLINTGWEIWVIGFAGIKLSGKKVILRTFRLYFLCPFQTNSHLPGIGK